MQNKSVYNGIEKYRIGKNKTTSVTVFVILFISVFLITFSIVINMFNINIFDARVIKEKFASSHKRFIALNDIYMIKNTAGEEIKLNQIEVTEIVMDRIVEILNLARKQILLLTKQNISYIVITGGLTEIRAFKNLVY